MWDTSQYTVYLLYKSRYLPESTSLVKNSSKLHVLFKKGHDLLLRVYTVMILKYSSSKASKHDTARYYRCIYASITPLLICFNIWWSGQSRWFKVFRLGKESVELTAYCLLPFYRGRTYCGLTECLPLLLSWRNPVCEHNTTFHSWSRWLEISLVLSIKLAPSSY